MDRGEYVPDGVMVEMVDERLHEPDASKGFILDGFPRTVPQARALEEVLQKAGTPLDAVVQFLITDDIAIRRITGRFTCPVCKRTYHEEFRPPADDRLCDADGTPLEKRVDEDSLTVKRRLAIYRDQTQPLEAFYAERELLRPVDATAPLAEVSERMFEALRDLV
jgi:adenylate kinase